MRAMKFFYGMLIMTFLNGEAMRERLPISDTSGSTSMASEPISPDTDSGAACEMQKNLINEMYLFMIEKDIDGLSSLLGDDFVLYHMTGMKQDKREYLEAIKDGTLNYYTSTLDNIIVKDNLNFIGQNQVSAAVFGGKVHLWHLQLEIELTKAGLIRSIKASTY